MAKRRKGFETLMNEKKKNDNAYILFLPRLLLFHLFLHHFLLHLFPLHLSFLTPFRSSSFSSSFPFPFTCLTFPPLLFGFLTGYPTLSPLSLLAAPAMNIPLATGGCWLQQQRQQQLLLQVIGGVAAIAGEDLKICEIKSIMDAIIVFTLIHT